MKTDIEIAHSATLRPIQDVAADMGVAADNLELHGKYIAKLPLSLINESPKTPGRLILVTAITPTKAGIGKTTVSIGLSLGLNAIGKKAVVALREPSLGPCFGMKGGAAGGGYAQVLPMDKINLHFTGDFHAITAAHNMIAALLDNYLYRRRTEGFGLKEVLWRRVLDVNDRGLRQMVYGLGAATNGGPQQGGFDITPASELMAILCLSTDEDDLRARIERILLGFDYAGRPFTVKDLGVAGAIMTLLHEALAPNLVQTTEGTPAIVHGGPFANIAHGCSSIVATRMAMAYADYAITEAGFGADLGAEKFYNIKCRHAGLTPALTIIVATAQGLKMHGGIPLDEIKRPSLEGVRAGLANLDRHIHNLRSFGQTVLVAFNRYAEDVEDEIELVRAHCEEEMGCPFAVNDAYARGGEGARALARTVVATIESHPSADLHYTYPDNTDLRHKIERVAKCIYGAASVSYSKAAMARLELAEKIGCSHLPVCIAKTQYSFSADPTRYGVAEGFDLSIREVAINAGAGMIVAVAGEIMRMPGLPEHPMAEQIDYRNGQITGLS